MIVNPQSFAENNYQSLNQHLGQIKDEVDYFPCRYKLEYIQKTHLRMKTANAQEETKKMKHSSTHESFFPEAINSIKILHSLILDGVIMNGISLSNIMSLTVNNC